MDAPVASSSSPTPNSPPSRTDSPPSHLRRERDGRKPPHLPFRRISLTSVPSVNFASHRISVASAGSIDSLPEDELAVHFSPTSSELHSSANNASDPQSVMTSSRLPERPELQRRPSSTGSLASIELSSRSRKQSSLRQSRTNRLEKIRGKLPVRPNNSALEAKRLKVMNEIWETECAYVDGLDLIYSHFLTPLIESLSDPSPLLTRNELTTMFSNFVDIWNLHRSFQADLGLLFQLSDVDDVASPSPSILSTSPSSFPDALHLHQHHSDSASTPPSPILPSKLHTFSHTLQSHFPYLSMYKPFVTAFPAGLALLTALSTPPQAHPFFSQPRIASSGSGLKGYDPAFALWLKEREADPKCKRLKLRDWMLTIIQRCPRYLLLLKDLISCTEEHDYEYPALSQIKALLDKITTTLNTSLRAHENTLSLISLQRATQNLPFPLIYPGRTLLRRSTVIKVDRGSDRRVRDILLFSDCLLWISKGGELEDWGVSSWADWTGVGSALEGGMGVPASVLTARNGHESEKVGNGLPSTGDASHARRPGRTRSRSDMDLKSTATVRPAPYPHQHKSHMLSSTISVLRPTRSDSTDGEERWWFRGKADLLDIEVVMSPIVASPEDECMFEVMSPEGSFALYAATEQERDEWVAAIRAAKASRLSSFQITHPHSTLTSSSSNAHLRRALQALPHNPAEESPPPSPTASNSNESPRRSKPGREKRRGKVEHFVPAIWVPDQKTITCMRCNLRFGWRRRRHHCRLCGRVVCASCSERTFYISDASSERKASTPARACNACYETVFPIEPSELDSPAIVSSTPTRSAVPSSASSPGNTFRPSFSLPSLALAIPPVTTPLLPSTATFAPVNNATGYFYQRHTDQPSDAVLSASLPPHDHHRHHQLRPPSLTRSTDTGSEEFSTSIESRWTSNSPGGGHGGLFGLGITSIIAGADASSTVPSSFASSILSHSQLVRDPEGTIRLVSTHPDEDGAGTSAAGGSSEIPRIHLAQATESEGRQSPEGITWGRDGAHGGGHVQGDDDEDNKLTSTPTMTRLDADATISPRRDKQPRATVLPPWSSGVPRGRREKDEEEEEEEEEEVRFASSLGMTTPPRRQERWSMDGIGVSPPRMDPFSFISSPLQARRVDEDQGFEGAERGGGRQRRATTATIQGSPSLRSQTIPSAPASRSVSRQTHQSPRKRVSIAPFPTQTPQWTVQDTSVTARTHAFGEGTSKRYSLMLGGTIRGGPGPKARQQQAREEDGGVGGLGKGDKRSFREGLVIGKLTDILSRDRSASGGGPPASAVL